MVLMFLAALVPAVCQQPAEIPEEPQSMPAPALPYYDFKACPFEGCTYGKWKARKAVTVYDTWKSNRKVVAKVSPGESVTGLNGVAITLKPGTIRLDRDLPNLNLKKGDTMFTYTYVGEGFSAVWFKGKFYPEFDISFTKWPDGNGCNGPSCAATYVQLGENEWWAQIKLKSGRTGWVNMEEAEFDGVDALAALTRASLS
jgi:hypothetical protein